MFLVYIGEPCLVYSKLKIMYMCTAKLLITKQGLTNYFETVEAFLKSKMNTNNTEIQYFAHL